MRNYRQIGSNKSYLMGLGSGKSQKSPKLIRVTDKLTRIFDTMEVVLKGTFVFEDTSFNYFDSLVMKVSSATDKKISLSDTLSVTDTMIFSHSSESNSFEDIISLGYDAMIITKV